LHADAKPVPSLWARLPETEVEHAAEALRRREKCAARDIGCWRKGTADPEMIPGLSEWAAGHGLHAVVWAALPPKFGEVKRTPSVDEVVNYLLSLEGATREAAERYIRFAPRQLNTRYRRV